MDRRGLSTALLASAAGAALLGKRSEAQTCTAPCYAQTAAEIAAGVTPSNTAYLPLNVLRYGAVGNGSTPDQAAFQAAINVARTAGGTVYLPAPPVVGGSYLLTAMLDCTYGGTANVPTWGFRGEPSSVTGGTPVITAKHTQTAVFDCTGNYGVTWQDFQLRCDSATFPKVGWLLARNSHGGSQLHRFRGIEVNGYFSDTVVYNFGSEQECYEDCIIYNNATSTATNLLTWTTNNYKNYTTTFPGVTMAAAPQSTTVHQIFGGSFANTGANAGSHVFYLEGDCDSVRIYGPWLYAANCQAYVYVDMSGGAGSCANFAEMDGVICETGTAPSYGILFSNHVNTPTGWSLTNWKSNTATKFLSAPANPTLDGFGIRHLSEVATKGVSITGTLQNSVVEILSLIGIGTSKNNKLIGDSGNWTITTRSNDNWDDTGTTNRTWTANTSDISVSGGITTNQGKYQLLGNVAHLNLVLIAGSSLSATVGQAISGLPFSASATGGFLNILDASTAQYIGSASVLAGQKYILLPAISARAGIVISGTYFVA